MKKNPFSKMPKGLKLASSPRQDDYRTFFMSEDTEKVYHKLEEIIGIC